MRTCCKVCESPARTDEIAGSFRPLCHGAPVAAPPTGRPSGEEALIFGASASYRTVLSGLHIADRLRGSTPRSGNETSTCKMKKEARVSRIFICILPLLPNSVVFTSSGLQHLVRSTSCELLASPLRRVLRAVITREESGLVCRPGLQRTGICTESADSFGNPGLLPPRLSPVPKLSLTRFSQRTAQVFASPPLSTGHAHTERLSAPFLSVSHHPHWGSSAP
jgi:hypothetical protein